MTNLGFEKDQVVDIVDFFKALADNGFSNKVSIINFAWHYAGGGYVTDGTTQIRVAGGFLVIGSLTSNFTSSWSNCVALYIPNDQTGSALYILSVTFKEDNQINSKKIIPIGS